MKKLALSMILSASLMVTTSAFALTSMTDSSMKSATGQAGVSIAFDNVKIEIWTAVSKFTDTDGTNGSAASLTISDQHFVKEYLAMVSEDDYTADFHAASGGTDAMGVWVNYDAATGQGGAHALTIDMGRCSVLSESVPDGLGVPRGAINIAGVIIGLPTLLIKTSSYSFDSGIEMVGAANDGRAYCRVENGANVTAILSGSIEIAPH